MSPLSRREKPANLSYPLATFRHAVLRGLGVVLPPLLTIVILIWFGSLLQRYILAPIETASRYTLVWYHERTLESVPVTEILAPLANDPLRDEPHVERDGELYVRLPKTGHWIPRHVRDAVLRAPGEPVPETEQQFYHRYVQISFLRKVVVIPLFLVTFVLLLYLLGKFLAAGVGRILWISLEGLISRLPLVRTVYSSVKQVTDFFFGHSEIEFNRVVAVQYPRQGIWSVGFATGDGLTPVATEAGEPVISVLMPTSPIPGTGFTIMVRKSETIELDVPIDAALQFVVSCGVVVPTTAQASQPGAEAATVPLTMLANAAKRYSAPISPDRPDAG
jgi:uncharacterized membrane protein